VAEKKEGIHCGQKPIMPIIYQEIDLVPGVSSQILFFEKAGLTQLSGQYPYFTQ
jgi:hypothetical protein